MVHYPLADMHLIIFDCDSTAVDNQHIIVAALMSRLPGRASRLQPAAEVMRMPSESLDVCALPNVVVHQCSLYVGVAFGIRLGNLKSNGLICTRERMGCAGEALVPVHGL